MSGEGLVEEEAMLVGGDAGEKVTLVHGATICVSGPGGDVRPDASEGVHHRDIRVVSRLALRHEGRPLPLLSARRDGAARARWVFVVSSDPHGTPTAVLVRTREVGNRVTERLTVHSYGQTLAGELSILVETDFANLLERRHGGPRLPARAYEVDGLRCRAVSEGIELQVAAAGAGVSVTPAGFSWTFDVAAGGRASCEISFSPSSLRDVPAEGFAPAADPPEVLEVRTVSHRWTRSIGSALEDLRGLRVEVPSMGLRYIGAGAPWFMALFGRDTLLTAWESLPAGTGRSLDVLGSLARWQGKAFDERTGEQPGKILHELRTGLAGVFGVEPGTAYYGTVDATPLFVMLLGEAHRWGAPDEEVRALLPAARAALRWCFEHGDADRDGFVEYVADPEGLANQGWKDSGDALVHADGSLASGPIALAEVQGYTYAACLALAQLEERLGEAGQAAALRRRAAGLRERFEAAFWLPGPGSVALALDGAKRPLEVATSNIGHVLWSGILSPGLAAGAADRLLRDDLVTAWGLRTLASSERAYNPLGYHLGSVWPHDTAIGVAGLVRHGRARQATRLVDGVLQAAEAFGWRLPELLAGLDAHEVAQPVPYPAACSPQAWSAAAPLLLLRAVLGLEPDVPAGVVHVAPSLPAAEEVEVHGVPLGSGSLSLRARGRAFEVLDSPPGVEVVAGPRPPDRW